jgi:hypothetical protein
MPVLKTTPSHQASPTHELHLPPFAYRHGAVPVQMGIRDLLFDLHTAYEQGENVILRRENVHVHVIGKNSADQLICMAWTVDEAGTNGVLGRAPWQTQPNADMYSFATLRCRPFRKQVIDLYAIGSRSEIPELLELGTLSIPDGPSDEVAGSVGNLRFIIELPYEASDLPFVYVEHMQSSTPQLGNNGAASNQWASSLAQSAMRIFDTLQLGTFHFHGCSPQFFDYCSGKLTMSGLRQHFLEGCLMKYAAQSGFNWMRPHPHDETIQFQRSKELPYIISMAAMESLLGSEQSFAQTLFNSAFGTHAEFCLS